jgi:hypothetical protein
MKFAEKTVTLPVSGKTALIREGDGYAEELLFRHEEKLHQALPDYWAYLTLKLGDKEKPDRDDILDLFVPDQRLLAIEIHRLSYGDELELESPCPFCGRAAALSVPLDKLEFTPLPEGLEPGDPTWSVKLPRSGKTVTLGFIRGREDLEDAETGFNPNRFDFKAVRAIAGEERVRYEAIRSLPLMDKKVLRREIAKMRVGYDTTVNVTCPAQGCGKRYTVNVLTDPGFLFAGFPA